MLFYKSLMMYISGLTKTKTCALVHNHNEQSHPRPGGLKTIPCMQGFQQLSMPVPKSPTCLGRPLCVACMQHRQDHQLHFSPLPSTPVQWTNCTTILGRSISRSPESFISVPCKLGLSCIICSLGWGEEWGRRCFCFPSRFTHKLSHTKPKQMSESS
jgi:hypothetical protein